MAVMGEIEVPVRLSLHECEISRLNLKPSEVLVVHLDFDFDPEECRGIKDVVSRVFPDNRVLVVGPGVTFEAVDQEAVDG